MGADIFIFDEADDTYPAKIPINPLVEKLGYKLYRSRLTGEMAAIMAYAKVDQSLLGDDDVKMMGAQVSCIIEQ